MSRLLTTLVLLLSISSVPKPDELAEFAPDATYIVKKDFLIGTPDRTGCPRWTLERIDALYLQGPGDRAKSHWHADPEALPERHATEKDYVRSGLSRGHMACAANHHHSQASMDDTHSHANAGPQFQKFNAQSWEHLEVYARKLTEHGATVWILTGPAWLPQSHTTKDGFQTASLVVQLVGPDDIWVPTHLWKSLLIVAKDGSQRIESFLAANSDVVAGEEIDAFRITTDDLEGKIGFDVWAALPDEIETALEAVK